MEICPQCQHLVPVANMVLHQARACTGRLQQHPAGGPTSSPQQQQDDTGGYETPLAAHRDPPVNPTFTSQPEQQQQRQQQQLSAHPSGNDSIPIVEGVQVGMRQRNVPMTAPQSPQPQSLQHPTARSTSTPDSDSSSPWNRISSTFRNVANTCMATLSPSNQANRDQQQTDDHDQKPAAKSRNTYPGTRQPETSTRSPSAEARHSESSASRRQSGASISSGILQVGDVVDLSSLDDDDTDVHQDDGWSCPRCTLRNSASRTVCDACLYHNSARRAADPVRREQLLPTDNTQEAPFLLSSLQSSDRNTIGNSVSLSAAGGALLGGALAATGAFVRGRPVTSAAVEGALHGAVGGAMVSGIVAANQENQRVQQQIQRQYSHQQGGPAGVRIIRVPGGRVYQFVSYSSSGPVTRNRRSVRSQAEMDFLMQSILQNQSVAGGNIDSMSYEQLLEHFGTGGENMGASQTQIASLPTTTVVDPSKLGDDHKQCSICLEDFAAGDSKKTLPCLHAFHTACVDKWLQTNAACPICKHRL